MKNMKENSLFCRVAVFFAALTACCGAAVAQNDACPGWNNPTSFDGESTSRYYYNGQVGTKPSSMCNVELNPRTGQICLNNIGGNTGLIGASNLTSQNSGLSGYSCDALVPSGQVQNRFFSIYDNISGYDPNTVGGTGVAGNNGVGLKYIPTTVNGAATGITKVIRVGDGCASNSDATALYYNMKVTSDNALLTIYYACVVELPSNIHGKNCDPAFIIRVEKKLQNGTWKQVSPKNWNGTPTGASASTYQCDTLCYMVPSTPRQQQSHLGNASVSGCGGYGTVDFGEDGWYLKGTLSSGGVAYKDWTPVVINLAGLMYETVRVGVMISDCCWGPHFAYAYVAGNCGPMQIQASGCPPGESTEVTTLTAPAGMRGYAWYASEYGVTNPQNMYTDETEEESTRYFTFDLVRDTILEGQPGFDSAHIYKVQASDFKVKYRKSLQHIQGIPVVDENGIPYDSIGADQLFRCSMRSYVDPSKPFWSDLYVSVRNTKPTMKLDSLYVCGGDVRLINKSEVPGDQTLADLDSTWWEFYHNANGLGTPDSIKYEGDTVYLRYTNQGPYSVRVRTNINETLVQTDNPPAHGACYTEKLYVINPRPKPGARMTIQKRILCQSDPTTTLTDQSTGATKRYWVFRDATREDTILMNDTVRDEATTSHTFHYSEEPIELWSFNGLYVLDSNETHDTVWCFDTVQDMVRVFVNPHLISSGDSIVCQGEKTDITVQAEGIDGCSYVWYSGPNGTGDVLSTSDNLKVKPTDATTTYYIKVTSPAPQNCVAWATAKAYLVSPTLTMIPADGQVCPGELVRLYAGNADHYSWTSSTADPAVDTSTAEVLEVHPTVNTTYTLIGHGSNNCDAEGIPASVTVFPLPVPAVSLEPSIVDLDDPTVVMRDVSQNSVGARWVFDDGSTAVGSEVTHTFDNAAGDTAVFVTLFPHNELECEERYRFSIPVNLYTAWLPTVFTPGSEDVNARFRLYTINDYEYFHIYIYNRRGELVYESSDPAFEWDGTSDGQPMPQGAYVYVCRYRKPGMFTLAELHGTVTLVR